MVNDAWSVFIIYEGPGAEDQVRAMIDDAREHGDVSFVMGGPGTPDWDLGAMEPGWEKHEYDRQPAAPAAQGMPWAIVQLLRAGKICGLDPVEMMREAFERLAAEEDQ